MTTKTEIIANPTPAMLALLLQQFVQDEPVRIWPLTNAHDTWIVCGEVPNG